MAPKLTPEEIVTLQVLDQKGLSRTRIAQTLGVTEGAVRYHLRRDTVQYFSHFLRGSSAGSPRAVRPRR